MGDDEDTGPITGGNRPPPSSEIGEELRRFFLELLEGDNLRRYQGEGRDAYVNARRSDLSDDAWRLINSGDLREIEQHIAEITGSGRAVLVCVVCPPM